MTASVFKPDNWILLEFKQKNKRWYQVLSSWDDSRYRMSSAVEAIIQNDDGLTFITKNGSKYECLLSRRVMNDFLKETYNNWSEAAEEESKGNLTIQIVETLSSI